MGHWKNRKNPHPAHGSFAFYHTHKKGAAVVVYYVVKLLLFSRMLFPKLWFPLPATFFSSMGEWAEPVVFVIEVKRTWESGEFLPVLRGDFIRMVTGGSEGIGRAYAFALAERGMNVVIMSRTKETLERVAQEIADATGQRVKVIVTDFVKEDVFSEIEDQLKDLNIGVLVNNVGLLPSYVPGKFLDSPDLEQTITNVINCNVKTMAKMCRIILPGMKSRGKGVIVNISSGVLSIPLPLYTLYASSKLFVERFSQGLQAEYKDEGIIIQTVAPFGISTRMSAYQKTNIVTLSPEEFVNHSLPYLRAGDKTRGSVCHMVLGWLLQCIPLQLLYTESLLQNIQEQIKNRTAQQASMSTSECEGK